MLEFPRSKTNQRGEEHELVVLPRAGQPARCPITALHAWLDAAGVEEGPVLRPVSKGNRPLRHACTPSSTWACWRAS